MHFRNTEPHKIALIAAVAMVLLVLIAAVADESLSIQMGPDQALQFAPRSGDGGERSRIEPAGQPRASKPSGH